MPAAVVLSRGLAGVDAPLVTVEVHLSGGLPAFNLVGLPDTEVKEARERVRAALANAQLPIVHANGASVDLADVRGQAPAKRALEIAAAGAYSC